MRHTRNTVGERPLTARSVIASTLLGLPGRWLDTRTLVRSGELFGIGEGTTRVALSRMRRAGELEARGAGYQLAGRLIERQERQTASRRGATRRWDGSWAMHVVVGEARAAADRAELRRCMEAGRRAELREGVWARPDNLGPGPWTGAQAAVVAAQSRTFTAHPEGPAALAAELWDLDGWAARADELRGRLERAEALLERAGTDALAETFVLAAAVLRHLQADPLLPGPLLPDGWPGAPLRHDYDAFDARFTQVWTDWYRSDRPVSASGHDRAPVPPVSRSAGGEAD